MDKKFLMRFARLSFGIMLSSLGIYMGIQANIGLAPWDTFTVGIANLFNITYGTSYVTTGLFILVVDVILKEKVGIGTLVNIFFIGIFVDMLHSINLIPLMTNFAAGVVLMLVSFVILSFGCYFYISPGFGCGARDSLLVALFKRSSNMSIGVVKALIEVSVLCIGWLLGAKVGVGTLLSAFGMSATIQIVFDFMKFNAKTLEHESLLKTAKYFYAKLSVNSTR